MTGQQIQIFTSQDGMAQLKVALDQNTVWLSQIQMATLFDTSTDDISLHLRNIYQEVELSESATTEQSSVVRQEGKRQARRQIKHYNPDAISSVGYRVSSQRATQFRQWAARVLKDHLVQGYSLNQRRLTERSIEFEQAVNLLSRTLTNQGSMSTEGEAVARIISDYVRSWSLLQSYDEPALGEIALSQSDMRPLDLSEALAAIAELKQTIANNTPGLLQVFQSSLPCTAQPRRKHKHGHPLRGTSTARRGAMPASLPGSPSPVFQPKREPDPRVWNP